MALTLTGSPRSGEWPCEITVRIAVVRGGPAGSVPFDVAPYSFGHERTWRSPDAGMGTRHYGWPMQYLATLEIVPDRPCRRRTDRFVTFPSSPYPNPIASRSGCSTRRLSVDFPGASRVRRILCNSSLRPRETHSVALSMRAKRARDAFSAPRIDMSLPLRERSGCFGTSVASEDRRRSKSFHNLTGVN